MRVEFGILLWLFTVNGSLVASSLANDVDKSGERFVQATAQRCSPVLMGEAAVATLPEEARQLEPFLEKIFGRSLNPSSVLASDVLKQVQEKLLRIALKELEHEDRILPAYREICGKVIRGKVANPFENPETQKLTKFFIEAIDSSEVVARLKIEAELADQTPLDFNSVAWLIGLKPVQKLTPIDRSTFFFSRFILDLGRVEPKLRLRALRASIKHIPLLFQHEALEIALLFSKEEQRKVYTLLFPKIFWFGQNGQDMSGHADNVLAAVHNRSQAIRDKALLPQNRRPLVLGAALVTLAALGPIVTPSVVDFISNQQLATALAVDQMRAAYKSGKKSIVELSTGLDDVELQTLFEQLSPVLSPGDASYILLKFSSVYSARPMAEAYLTQYQPRSPDEIIQIHLAIAAQCESYVQTVVSNDARERTRGMFFAYADQVLIRESSRLTHLASEQLAKFAIAAQTPEGRAHFIKRIRLDPSLEAQALAKQLESYP